MSSFFNCHCHSEYSALDGISYVEDIVKRAKELNYSAVALTDHGEVGGHLELEKYAKQYDIKPVYGIETYVCEDRTDRDKTKKRGESSGHMVILAMTDQGLKNLWALSSLAYTEGKYYDPRIDWELLEKYNEGLIVTGACFLEDAPIMMSDGIEIPISKVQPGQYVVTHLGNINKVVNVWPKQYDGKLTTLKFAGDQRKLVATGEHKIWSRVNGVDDWREISLLSPGDFISMSARHDEVMSKLEDGLGWFIGVYLGDGYRRLRNRKRDAYEIRIALSLSQYNEAKRLAEIAKKYFYAEAKIYQENNVLIIRFFSKKMHQFLGVFGDGAKNKSLPRHFMAMPLISQQELIDGLMLSDGNIDKSGRYNIRLANEVLIRQIREILIRLGYSCTIRNITSPGGPTNRSKISYQWGVSWRPNRNRWINQYNDNQTTWHKVINVNTVEYNGEVWDMEVEGDHSFRAFGIGVHNCMGGWVGKDIVSNPMQALTNASRLQAIFGDRFYLELHTLQNSEQEEWNKASIVLAKRLSIPLIVVNDSHYTHPEDWYLHECITAVQMGKTMSDPSRFHYGENQLSMLGETESRQRLSYLPDDVVDQAIENTGRIAEMCNAEIPRQSGMPLYFDDKEMDADALRENIKVGFENRVKPHLAEDEIELYWDRIQYETNVIIDHGFQGYFLIVQDIINWSKNNDILIGPARGSVAGSAVALALGITEVDPIKHDLYFERFLDIGRVSLPDIDIDVPQDQRHLIKEYLETKYGKDAVASIGIFNTMAHKQAIKDLCRGLDIPIDDANKISNIIDSKLNINGVLLKDLTWQQILNFYAVEFSPWIARYPRLFKLLPKTVGHVRHHGIHAAGMVVNKDELIGKLPLRYKTDEEVSTQFDMHGVEDLGFVKIDILGLRTLSTLSEAMRLIKERHGENAIDHFYDWSHNWEKYYEDPKVWEDISSGNDLGIFQLETSNLSQLSKRFKPKSMDELGALISVCRPGISRTIDDKTGLNYLELYLQKRDKKVPIVYKHPKLKEILGSTLGTFVYQEQTMKAAVEIAGYSLEEADRLRKIIGKSQADRMKEEREIFVSKSVLNGTNEDLADSIFDELEKFGQYGFNKGHALGYSFITYWTAYLKTYFPHEFMTALFRTNPKMAPLYTKEARRLGISVLGPDINESGEKVTLTKNNSIRYGLESIKYISGTTAKAIEELQPFDSMADFISKITKSKIRINKNSIYSMISVGTFDSLSGDTVNALREFLKEKQGWSDADFNSRHIEKVECELCHGELTKFECLKLELNINNRAASELANLGSLVTINPLHGYTELIRKETTFPGEEHLITGEKVIVGGLLSEIRPLVTKKGKNPGQKMAQITLDLPEEDSLFIEESNEEGEITNVSSLKIVVFPSVYKLVKDKLEQGSPVLIKVEKLDSGLSLQNIWRLDLLKEG